MHFASTLAIHANFMEQVEEEQRAGEPQLPVLLRFCGTRA